MFYTYVMQSLKNYYWYTGSTNDLRKRFNQHNIREKYLKSGMGKRYLETRLKRFLSLTV